MSITKRLKNALKVLLGKSIAVPNKANAGITEFECPICKKKNITYQPLNFYYLRQMQRYGFEHSIFKFETLNLEHYNCSNCKSNDRDRLYALYFDIKAKQLKETIKVLDIAPSFQLNNYIKKINGIEVRTADLMMPDVDDTNMDITAMPYSNESFDAFICSHVLEHIEDDGKAMSELYRILKTGGWGIAMVPINTGIALSIENKTINSVDDRWKHYGQDDHVRLYSKNDFVNRLSKVGFTVSELGIDFFGSDAFNKAGIYPSSILYIVSK